ncbi:MAG: YidC/Oxa1 family membrane protein insertase [Candidatus Portnoybacteria bacterium]|nr:YidC/Oxa1 family membrane protein insertase [Candidatus Portnoybacteria bacterium]
MSFISLAFQECLYRPLFNGLIFLYNIFPWHDFGLSIVLLTVLIRLVLYPLNQKSIKSQAVLNKLQPEIKDLQQKYKDDKVRQSQEMMALYKTKNINPASGCLPLLIQLPILFALYRVFWTGLDPSRLEALYSFVSRPESINPIFLGLVNLSQANIIMAILAGAFTFIQSKMMAPKTSVGSGHDFSSALNKQMVYFMPLITVFIAWKLPAGLVLYWIITTLFGIGQQYLILRKKNGN